MAGAVATQQEIFESGRSGKDVRSDLHVTFVPHDAGGLKVDLKSRVATYYGGSIRAQAEQVLQKLGVAHCQLSIEDEGA
jgi:citrate lyase subunit beta/citryl-CoA lyase